jgi:hypothetical protein
MTDGIERDRCASPWTKNRIGDRFTHSDFAGVVVSVRGGGVYVTVVGEGRAPIPKDAGMRHKWSRRLRGLSIGIGSC